MKDRKLYFLIRCLQIVFVFSLLVVVLQVYLHYVLPNVVDSYTKKYTEQTVEQTVQAIEQKFPELIGTYLVENNNRLTNSISEILAKNASISRPAPVTMEDKIDRYLGDLLELPLSGQTKIVLGDTQDVVLFEFFDYQCGFCKRFYGSVKTAKQKHNNLQVKYVDYPVLGNMSVLASTVGLALSEQNLYTDMHNALMQYQGRLTPQVLEEVGEKIGFDKEQLEQDMSNSATYADTLSRHLKVGKDFGIKGTPYSLIISLNKEDKVVGEEISGYIDDQTLSKLVTKYTND